MMKRNAIARTLIASAVLAVVGAAQAGSITVTTRTVANEAFGTAIAQPTVAAGAVSLPALTYTFNTPGGIVVNPGGSVNVVFTLVGGTPDVTGAVTATNVTLSGAVTALTPTVSATGSKLVVNLLNPTASTANVTIGIGAAVTLASTGSNQQYRVTGVTKGTDVTVTGQATNGADNSVLEAATAASTAVTYAEAVTAALVASTSTVKINLNTTPNPGTALTTGTAVSLGSIKLTNTAGTQAFLNNAGAADTDFTAAGAGYAQTGTVVVGLASGSFTPGTTFGLYQDDTCATAVGTAGTVAYTPASTTGVAAATTSVSIPYTTLNGATVVAGASVCASFTGVAAGTAIKEFTPTIAFTYDKSSTSYTDETIAATAGYALRTNGQVVDVRSYIPAAATGYTSFVRVINTGAVAAAVTASFIDETTGIAGTSGSLGTLAAGASKTWTSAQIEAAIGVAPAGTARPRVRLTAPTSGLQAQSFFLTNANGNFSDVTGAQ